MQIDKRVLDELNGRGFHVSASPTRRVVLEFETHENSIHVFRYFRRNGYMRIIFTTIYEEIPLTVDETRNILVRDEKLKKALPMSPSRNIYCRNCKNVISSYNPFTNRKPWRKETCPLCHVTSSLRDCEIGDDSELTDVQITSLLDELVSARLLTRSSMGFCRNCSTHRDLQIMGFGEIDSDESKDLREYVKSLYCDTCHEPLSIYDIYKVDEYIDQFFRRDGVWLEWYVKNLIKQYDAETFVEQGLIVHNDEIAAEVDVLALKDGKISCFECKAFNPLKRVNYGDVAEAIQMGDFADRIFLVTTGNVKRRAERLLSKNSVRVVKGLSIEQIGKLYAS